MGVLIHIDGGARGNPGPAGAGVVIQDTDDRTVLFEGGFFLGQATNNVAEYQGLVRALAKAAALGAKVVEVRSDSELLVRQMNGQYRVKSPGLLPLHQKAAKLRNGFERCEIRHVRREANTAADRLANMAVSAGCNVKDAAE